VLPSGTLGPPKKPRFVTRNGASFFCPRGTVARGLLPGYEEDPR